MSAKSATQNQGAAGGQASWLPFAVIVLAQAQMAFNVNALPVSIGPIVEEFGAPATSIGTALVIYSLFVAAFVMVGAKLGKIFGERLVFQVTAVAHGLAMALMAFSPDVAAMNVAQALAGLAAAGLVPTLVVLIAANYRGQQQAQALGFLAGTPAMAGATAFFLAGFLATAVNWRISFLLMFVTSLVVLALSFRMKPIPRQSGIRIDGVGALLVALAVVLISFGFDYLNTWGVVTASPAAPFSFLGLSPAPFMIVAGLIFGQAFFVWAHRRAAEGKVPLLALEVLDTPQERAAIYTMLVIGAVAPAVNFLIPLYIQIVEGRTSLETAVALVPYTLTIFASAALVVRFYARFSPRQIGSIAFVVVAVGLTLLAFTIGNSWGTLVVIIGMIILGLGEGALLALLFNVLVSASPKELAGDVGALRGTANNLSTAVGTAVASVLAVSLLAMLVASSLADHPTLPPELLNQVNLDQINFISNDQLETVMAATDATPAQVTEAARINEQARLLALKMSFLVLAAIAALAIIPALGLPKHVAIEEKAST
jgi:MFS family permease